MLSAFKQLQRLNAEIFSCFLHIEYKENIYLFEKRLHVQKLKCLQAMLRCRNTPRPTILLNQLDKLYDIMLDGALLRRRVSDYTTFGICADEYKLVLQAMEEAFDALQQGALWNNKDLETAIKAVEDNYHTVVQVTAREPLVFLLFIASLRAWSKEMAALFDTLEQTSSSRGSSSCHPESPCHPERSEGSHSGHKKILRCAQDDKDAQDDKEAQDDKKEPRRKIILSTSNSMTLKLFKVLLCTLVALLLNRYASFSHQYWLVCTATLVSFFGMDAPIRKSMLIFVLMLAVAMLTPTIAPEILKTRLLDISVGAVLGMMFNHVIFPSNFSKRLHQGLVPVLQAAQQYADLLTQAFLQQTVSITDLKKARLAMEQTLLFSYPEWVYALGFNPRLRAGFRFFLIYTEQMVEVLFSMDYWRTCAVDAMLIQDLAGRIKETTERNHELFAILLAYFANNEYVDPVADFTSDLAALEEALQRVLPAELELLDISADYLVLAAFVRDLKDMREILLQLVMALPAEVHRAN